MGKVAIALGGMAIGFALGGPMGAKWGLVAGELIGGALFPKKLENKVSDYRVVGADYGTAIPIVYGTFRTAGNIIWSSPPTKHSESSGKGGVEATNEHYTVSCAILASVGPVVGITRIWANSKLIWDGRPHDEVPPEEDPPPDSHDLDWWRYTSNPQVPGSYWWRPRTPEVQPAIPTIYLGTEVQMPDPTMEAVEGVDYVPAHRGLAYVVFENMNLQDYGNSLPNFTIEVVQAESVTVSQIISDVLGRVGITSGQCDLTETDDLVITGIAINSQSSVKEALSILTAAYHFDIFEVDGKIKTIKRSHGTEYTIPLTDLAAREPDAKAERLELTRIQEVDLPRAMEITYMSLDEDFQQAIARAIRLSSHSNNSESLTFALSATDAEARKMAEAILQEFWVGRTQFKVTLPWKYLYLSPCDVLNIVGPGDIPLRLRINKLTSGAPGVIEALGREWDPDIYTQVTIVKPPLTDKTIPRMSDTLAYMGNLPALRDEDGTVPGNYWALYGNRTSWRQGLLYQGGRLGYRTSSFTQIGSSTVQPVAGQATTILADADHWSWDEVSTVTVAVPSGTMLESITDSDVLNGANAAVLGEEIIQFGVATQVDQTHWTLSHLLRGRKGTEHQTGTHQVGDTFVMLTNGGVYYQACEDIDIDKTYYYKAVTPGQVVDDIAMFSFVITAGTLKPWSVAQLNVAHESNDDISATWVRRARFGGNWLDGHDVPLNEETELYEVDIMDGETVVRTISRTVPNVTYTLANHLADFGSWQEYVTLRVYQISSRVGRGVVKEETFHAGTRNS